MEKIRSETMGILKERHWLKANPFLSLSIFFIVSTRLITFMAFPTPTVSPDTTTYFTGKFLDFTLVSFWGNASRGWLVPFVYALMPNAIFLELFQLLFSGLAWSILIVSIHAAKMMPWRYNELALLFLGFIGSSSHVVQHDTSVLSTSITNSIFILLISFLIRAKYVQKRVNLNLITCLFFSSLLMIQKTSFIPIAFGLSFVLILSIYGKKNKKKRLLAVGVLTLLTVYSISVGSNVDKQWQISYSGQTLLWQLGGQSPAAAEFSAFLKTQDAPQCITNDAPFQDINISIGAILNSCPEAISYLKRGIQRDFAKFVMLNPLAVAKLAVLGMGASVTSSATNYGNTVSLLPKFFSEIFFGSTTPSLLTNQVDDQISGFNVFKSGAAFWLYTPFFGWLLLAMLSTFLRGQDRKKDTFLHLILILCLLQSVFVLVLLPSEWVRQTSPFLIGALIVAVVLSIKNTKFILADVSKNGKQSASE